MKVKVTVSLDLVGCTIKDVLDLDDDMSDEDIEAEVDEWAHEHMEYWWEKTKEGEDYDE